MFENSMKNIWKKELLYSSTLVCYFVYSPRVLKTPEITPLMRFALIATTIVIAYLKIH